MQEKHRIFKKPDNSYSTQAIEEMLEKKDSENQKLRELLSNKHPRTNINDDPNYIVPSNIFMGLLNANLLNIGSLSIQPDLALKVTEEDHTWLSRLKIFCQHQPKPFDFIPTIYNNIVFFYRSNWFRLPLIQAISIIINYSNVTKKALRQHASIATLETYFIMTVTKITPTITKMETMDCHIHTAFQEIAAACRTTGANVKDQVKQQQELLEKADFAEQIWKKDLGTDLLERFQ